jgi:hypothetical protein
MTLINPKPLGWAFGEILTSAQMNSFGTQIIRALDGTGGGSYTLAAPLIIDGDVVQLSELEATVGIIDALQVNNTALFGSDVNVTGDVFADDLVATDDVTAGGDLSVGGNASVGGIIGFTGTGRIKTTGAALPNADTSVDVATARHLYAAPATTAKTYTLSCTNEADGDWFRFVNGGSVSATLAGLVSIPALGAGIGRMYIRIAGVWTLVDLWSTT